MRERRRQHRAAAAPQHEPERSKEFRRSALGKRHRDSPFVVVHVGREQLAHRKGRALQYQKLGRFPIEDSCAAPALRRCVWGSRAGKRAPWRLKRRLARMQAVWSPLPWGGRHLGNYKTRSRTKNEKETLWSGS